jgi:hypothetical protein
MSVKKKYVVRKVDEAGEDVTVDAKAFDKLLGKLIKSSPIPQESVRGQRAKHTVVRKVDALLPEFARR